MKFEMVKRTQTRETTTRSDEIATLLVEAAQAISPSGGQGSPVGHGELSIDTAHGVSITIRAIASP
jgi:hypothetical protein